MAVVEISKYSMKSHKVLINFITKGPFDEPLLREFTKLRLSQ